MADELSVTTRFVFSKSSRYLASPPEEWDETKVTVTGDDKKTDTQALTTAGGWTAIDFGDVTQGGFVWFRNLTTGGTIEIGVDAGGVDTEFATLAPGEPPLQFRCISGITYKARAATVDSVLEMWAIDP